MIHLVTVASVFVAKGLTSATVIDRDDGPALDHWAFRLSVSRDAIADAIDTVGPSVAAVRRHLGK